MRKILLAAATMALLSTPAEAIEPAQGAIIIGESFSSCAFDQGTSIGPCWPDLLRTHLQGVQVTNLAIGGFGTAQQNAIHLQGNLTSFYCGPGAFRCWGIIMVGFSEANIGRTWWELHFDIMTITEELESAGLVHTLLIIEPVNHPKGGLTPVMRTLQLQLCIDDPARWSCLDFAWDFETDFDLLADGTLAVHPNPAAHERLATAVQQALGW